MKPLLFVVSTYAIFRIGGARPPSENPDDVLGHKVGVWLSMLLIFGGCTVGMVAD